MDQISRALLTVGSSTTTTYVDDVFSTYLYTGTGAAQTITNGLDLLNKGGLVWTKNRTATTGSGQDHWLVSNNSETPASSWSYLYHLKSNTTDANFVTGSAIGSFNNNGYSIASAAYGFSEVNVNYVSWSFKRAPKFFDVVTFTANASGVATISHSLGIVPGAIIIKQTSTVDNWYVYHRSGTSGKYLILNGTGSEFTGSYVTSISATSVGIGQMNANAQGVAYLFAHNAATDGLIQCGSYIGNGSSTGPTVNLGWEPQWLLIKNASGTGGWILADNMRGIVTDGNDSILSSNVNSAEYSQNLVELTPIGFKITNSSTDVNNYTAGYSYNTYSYNYSTSTTISASSTRGPSVQDCVADTTAAPNVSPCYIFANVTAGEWISFDLGGSTAINQILYRNTAGSNWAPTSIKIQYSSDNTNWIDATTYSDNASTSVQTISFSTISARYWRIYQNSATRQNSSGYEWHFNNVRIRNNGSDAMIIGGTGTTTTVVNVPAVTYNYNYIAIRRPNKPPTAGTSVFSVKTYSATTSSASVTHDVTFDVEINANRDVAGPGFLIVDSLRGIDGKVLQTVSTTSEAGYPTYWSRKDQRTMFASSGFDAWWASSSGINNHISYALARAPGFFDVVCYTGNDLDVPHTLGVMPELIISKPRSSIKNWYVYATSQASLSGGYWFPGTYGLGQLNLTSAFTSTAWIYIQDSIKNSVFHFGDGSLLTSATHVAYLFASLPGISKVGSYTGNGGTQTINCGFTTGTRFVLVKRIDNVGDWYVWDTARGIISANDPHSSFNFAAAEVTTDDSIDPDNTGFIVNQVAATNINVTSAIYIYLAIA